MLTTPVLFIIFNRPDTTQLVFNEIKKAKPSKLYIAADGPRPNREDEAEKCQQSRNIIKQIDWDCEIHTLFRNQNLGCKVAVSSAIDWFFENVEEGIILEDDCLPDQSFFYFCQELLEKYRDDKRIMMISGDNFQDGIKRGDGSYYFSRIAHIWGWATWKRAWNLYDVQMKSFKSFLENGEINNIFDNKYVKAYWLKYFQNTYEGKIDTWDYQWGYTLLSQNGLSIMPNVNLISNIGFRKDENNKYANMKTFCIDKIVHPNFILVNKEADDYTFVNHHGISFNFLCRFIKKLKREICRILKQIFKRK